MSSFPVSLVRVSASLGIAACFAACSGSSTASSSSADDAGVANADTSGGDASSNAEADASAARAPSFPKAVSKGGPTIAAPHVVPVFFSSDALQAGVESYLGALAASSFWKSTVSEYGVGELTVDASVVVDGTPPANPADLTTFLNAHAPADSSTILLVMLPEGAPYTDAATVGTSCTNFDAFHDEYDSPSGKRAFALSVRCSNLSDFGVSTALDEVTVEISHELAEVTTDPFPTSAPAYDAMDDDHAVWSLVPYAELADLCTQEGESDEKLVGTYMVQRLWSNAASAAGHDPCTPAMGTPYFYAAPVLTEDVPISGMPSPTTKGISLAVGQSKTIDVVLAADSAIDPWLVEAFPLSQTELRLELDASGGRSGDTLHLKITRLAAGQTNGGSTFAILSAKDEESLLDTTKPSHFWYGFVANE